MSPMRLANRVAQIPRPATLAINARVRAMQAAGADIVNLSVGEPDFPTPERICAAAQGAMNARQTRYTDVQGILPLREAVTARIQKDYGVSYAPDEVMVANGGKQCLYNVFQAVINPGDEVLIPAPYWLTYPPQVLLAGGVPIVVPTLQQEGFQIDVERLEAACTPRTRAIVINSPCNPTGVLLRREVLEPLAELICRRDLLLVTDDLYHRLVYGGRKFESVASLGPEVKARTVIIGGVSKAYAMTGWRIGYALGQKPLIAAMTNIQGQVTSNAASISQYAALEALTGAEGDAEVDAMVAEFSRRCDRMVELLEAIPGVRCVRPGGAFYTFPNVSGFYGRRTPKGRVIEGSIAMGEYLVEEVGLAGVPGIEFGNDDHIRFSYACSMALLEDGMARFHKALAALR